MKNHDVELKLQALVDGELDDREAARMTALVEQDPEARAVHNELAAIKTLLAGNEPELKVPETREFYWSGIARAIEREDLQAGRRGGGAHSHSWLRLILPAGAVATLALGLTIGFYLPGHGKGRLPALVGSHEIETTLEDTPTFTFRSDPEAMTVVWVDSGPN